MGALLLLGCVMIGFALPAALFALLLMRRSQLVIVMLASAFFWLMSLTASSLIWSAIPPLQDSAHDWAIVPVSVLLQEAARALFIILYFRCERSFSVVSINAIVFPLVDLWSSIAAGVGFGASQSFMFYAPVVARALGPGALFSPHCSAFSTTILAAWNALLFNAMHVLLMIIAFDAYRSMSPPRIGAVVVLHAAAASFTILNRVDDGCVISLPLIAAIVVITALWTLLITHRPEYRSNKGRRTHQA